MIHLVQAAPPKPAVGAPCNGCGVCCLAEPCPLGVLLSGRRTGACDAVRWDEAARRYRCSAADGTSRQLPAWLYPAAPALQALARRWIAAGKGCDCSLEVSSAVEDA